MKGVLSARLYWPIRPFQHQAIAMKSAHQFDSHEEQRFNKGGVVGEALRALRRRKPLP